MPSNARHVGEISSHARHVAVMSSIWPAMGALRPAMGALRPAMGALGPAMGVHGPRMAGQCVHLWPHAAERGRNVAVVSSLARQCGRKLSCLPSDDGPPWGVVRAALHARCMAVVVCNSLLLHGLSSARRPKLLLIEHLTKAGEEEEASL
jgi:hypothetical protein